MGLNRLDEIFSPPCAAPPARATPAAASSIGAAAPAAPAAAIPSTWTALSGSGRAITSGSRVISVSKVPRSRSTVIGARKLNASTVSHAATSAERGTCPSRTACLRRCAVGFSVFCDLSSATARTPRPVLAAPKLSTMRSMIVLTAPGSRPTATAARLRVSRILTGKPIANTFSDGRRPAEQAERELGEEEHRDQRRRRSAAPRRRTCRRAARTVWVSTPMLVGCSGNTSYDAMKPRSRNRWPFVANSRVTAISWWSRPNMLLLTLESGSYSVARVKPLARSISSPAAWTAENSSWARKPRVSADDHLEQRRPGAPGTAPAPGPGRPGRGPSGSAIATATRDLDHAWGWRGC